MFTVGLDFTLLDRICYFKIIKILATKCIIPNFFLPFIWFTNYFFFNVLLFSGFKMLMKILIVSR